VALSLTFDHRIVDGGPAARFLQRIKHYVERPIVWLTR
jgi:pyruvate dehydrogenase E2 component (dihydrolipoamide acetyltransferase)